VSTSGELPVAGCSQSKEFLTTWYMYVHAQQRARL